LNKFEDSINNAHPSLLPRAQHLGDHPLRLLGCERPISDAPMDEAGEFEDEFEDEFESEDEILEAGFYKIENRSVQVEQI
jgi:hypothetical protein